MKKGFSFLLTLVLALSLNATAFASEYSVQKGDSLWRIAQKQYGSGKQWTVIYQANKQSIKNPNVIYIGQKLNIPDDGAADASPAQNAAAETPAAQGGSVSAPDTIASVALTNLTMEDPAQLASLKFDPNVSEYNITVFEDVYGLRFTPTIEGAGTVKVSVSGSGIEEETFDAANGTPFELHLTQSRECSAKPVRGMEDDCDYIVKLTASEKTYTIHVHRPGTDALVEQYERRTWTMSDGKEMTYWLYLPASYDESKTYPVVICPHGGGQFAVDAEDILVRTAQATAFAKYGKDVIVLATHSNYTTLDYEGEFTRKWAKDDMTLSPFSVATMDILSSIEETYRVDKNRIYVAGGSQGGRAAIAFVVNYPEVFAAAIICAPAFDTMTSLKDGAKAEATDEILTSVAKLAEVAKENKIAIWLVQAEKDPTVDILATRTVQAALDKAGVAYQCTIYPETTYLTPSNHFSWVPFFDNEANIDWLLSQSK